MQLRNRFEANFQVTSVINDNDVIEEATTKNDFHEFPTSLEKSYGLCGFSQEHAFGKNFSSMGIQSSVTEAEKVVALASGSLNENMRRCISQTQPNMESCLILFENYVRVAPLMSGMNNATTHFIVAESKKMHTWPCPLSQCVLSMFPLHTLYVATTHNRTPYIELQYRTHIKK